MGFIQEFKAFAMKGNVMDMAIGIIIGGAFGLIISSLVNDIIMPPIGMLLGNVDFKELMFVLKPATATTAVVAIKYGSFINNIISFLIVALSIFMAIKVMNKMKKKEEIKPAEPPKPSRQEQLLEDIKDILQKQK